VPLAPLRDPSLVTAAIEGELDVTGDLADGVAGKRLLVLLDNAEHVVSTAARCVASMRDVAGPTVLVTSRERLQLDGEHVFGVPGLDTEDGVELFHARARTFNSAFPHSPAVNSLCERLDNLPLAIELAAARTVVFSPEQLLERLGQRLDLLKGGREVDPRQQTLRATIEWSFELLTPEEQALLAALSVFAGGCTYEAADQVCGADPDTLQSLLDKSLVRRRDTERAPRYWLLETLRQFAAEALSPSVRADVHRAHAEYFVAYVVGLAKRKTGISDDEGLRALSAEGANIHAALAWAVEHEEAQLFASTAGALWPWWLITGWGREGLERTMDVLQRSGELSEDARLELLLAASELTRLTGDLERALAFKRQLLDVAGDDDEIAAHVLADMADIELIRGRLSEATELAEASLDRGGGPRARASLAEIALARGDYATAVSLTRAAADEFAGVHDVNHALSLEMLGEAERLLGHHAPARDAFEAALTSLARWGDRGLVAECVEGLAALAADEGEDVRANELFAVVAALRVGSTMPPARPSRGRTVEVFEDMTLDDAVQKALSP
jgi:predicted ATPase